MKKIPTYAGPRRVEIIQFRMTTAERAALEKAAAGSRSVSDWLREVVLSHAVPEGAANKKKAHVDL